MHKGHHGPKGNTNELEANEVIDGANLWTIIAKATPLETNRL
jgi:hypothetical protein